jgi:hypothetical protein
VWWLLTQQIDRGDCSAVRVTDILDVVDTSGILQLVDLVEDASGSRAVVLLESVDGFVI